LETEENLHVLDLQVLWENKIIARFFSGLSWGQYYAPYFRRFGPLFGGKNNDFHIIISAQFAVF
jgi:hypothetical protein